MPQNLGKITPILIRKLSVLSAQVPPEELFERAIGYRECQRFVGFYFIKDELYYEDGTTWDRGDLEPFELWSRVIPEWRIEIELACIREPIRSRKQNWLLLDRLTRKIHFGNRDTVISILAGQLQLSGRADRLFWNSIRAGVIIGLAEWFSRVELPETGNYLPFNGR